MKMRNIFLTFLFFICMTVECKLICHCMSPHYFKTWLFYSLLFYLSAMGVTENQSYITARVKRGVDETSQCSAGVFKAGICYNL